MTHKKTSTGSALLILIAAIAIIYGIYSYIYLGKGWNGLVDIIQSLMSPDHELIYAQSSGNGLLKLDYVACVPYSICDLIKLEACEKTNT